MKVEVKRLELTDELIGYGILDVYYNNEKIEIMYTRLDGKEDIITLSVREYAHDTIQELDSEVNGSMSLEAFTLLKYYLTLKLTPVWDEIKGRGPPHDTNANTSVDSEYGNLTSDQFEQELIKRYHFKATKDTEDLYYYDSAKGLYLRGGEWLIKQECLKFSPGITSAKVDQIIQHIIWGDYVDRSQFDPNIEWLCCKNVMVNLKTREVKEHSPDFMATVQIPHDYPYYRITYMPRPEKILKFLREVMASDEDVETVLDFIAYCLWRDLPYHKWLLLNGSGRNGKGTTLDLITRFLGIDNVSNETLERLTGGDKFATAGLYGKLANIDADLSSDELKKTGTLKKITGGDRLPGEFKFKPVFYFKNRAKIIFSANIIPDNNDDTVAFHSRYEIINYPNQYLPGKADPYLITKLTAPDEMSAFLSLILKRLPRVLEKGISSSKTIEENYTKYKESSDPIGLFIEMAIVRTDLSDDKRLTKEQVYLAYEHFCFDKKLSKESSETFSRRLKAEGFNYKPKKNDGIRTYVWVDLDLKDYRQAEEGQDTL